MDTIFKSNEELPLSLQAKDLQAATGLSRAGVYNLMKSEGFPSIRIGKRIIVPKDAFIRWMEVNTGKQVGA